MRRAMAMGIAIMTAHCSGSCGHEAATSGATPPPPPSGATEPPLPSGATEPPSPSVSEGIPALAARLEALRLGGRRDVPYRPPQPEEESAYTEWVIAVTRAASAGETPTAPPPPGFALERVHDVWLLAEEADSRRGAGAVAVRIGGAAPVLVEAPHTFFDMGTLPIALAAFDAGRCRALLVNTVHRHAAGGGDTGAGEDDGGGFVSDVAHAPSSFFLAAHRALLGLAPAPATVQIHGFADQNAPGAGVILSAAGSSAPLDGVADRLRAVVGDGVRRYPAEVSVLGGLKNVQAVASRTAGAPFLHVEISRTLRDRLAGDDALRRRAGAALVFATAP